MRKKILCLDIETTGFRKEDEILQLAFVTNSEGEVFNEFYRPVHNREWPEAEEVNHISPESVRGKYPFEYEDNIAQIQDAVRRADVIVGYNIKHFDIPFLEKYGIDFSGKEVHDAMLMYGKLKPASRKLSSCAEHFGYKYKAHDALEDVKATLYCYEKMVAIGVAS